MKAVIFISVENNFVILQISILKLYNVYLFLLHLADHKLYNMNAENTSMILIQELNSH